MLYRDIPYVTDGHPRQKFDLYLPEQAVKAPLIIWVHGGAWLAGSKEDFAPLDYLTAGYAVASINYRLSQHATFPAQIEDCKSAIRWLRGHADLYHLDPQRFGAWGASAGGHLVALLGTTGHITEFDVGENLDLSSRIQAAVDYYGPTDFLQMDEHRLPQGMSHNPPNSPESLLVGGAIQEMKAEVTRANSITYVRSTACPFLIVHGDTDPLVPFHQSVLLEEALRKAGATVQLYPVAGAGHGEFTDPKVGTLTQEFFATHLLP